ncbi:ribosomal protein L17 [Cryptococcus neoformans]|nr:ribosomal protein L17 [Cryptococcus neoformans var. grubii]OXC61811.1 ribosomal protein L17 [Cryptococcus neoformans var. grubii MW-RSA852]
MMSPHEVTIPIYIILPKFPAVALRPGPFSQLGITLLYIVHGTFTFISAPTLLKMKHGIHQRKLGRMPAHRIALLRNLVSALLHHESIKTTLPKAKEAAKMAEKIITLGKKGTNQAKSKATAYLMPAHHAPSSSYTPSPSNPTPTLPPLAHPQSLDPETFTPPTSLLPKLFTTLATRYAARPGGYTRIHKFGRRPGDNAPHAILTLVDGPRDLKFEMIARTAGKESLDAMDSWEQIESSVDEWEGLSEKTKRDVAKVLRYRSEDDKKLFKAKATEFSDLVTVEDSVYGGVRKPALELQKPSFRAPSLNHPRSGKHVHAGERLSGMSVAHTGLGLARGALARSKSGKSGLDRTPLLWGQSNRLDGVKGEVITSNADA